MHQNLYLFHFHLVSEELKESECLIRDLSARCSKVCKNTLACPSIPLLWRYCSKILNTKLRYWI